MKNLHFKYARAKNFLCFGPEGIEVNFENLGNIVLIRGEILDSQSDTEDMKVASNGVGKSSIPEIIVYTIYGKTIKKPKKIGHADVINNQIGKKLETEIIVDNLRIVRTRKPDTLRVWESDDADWNDDTEITLGGMPATQKLIEDKIGLSYSAFVNICVFTDDNNAAFLECDGPEKRQIVENMLSLEKYRDYFENAKKAGKDSKDRIKNMSKEYELLLNELSGAKNRLTTVRKQEGEWKQGRLNDLKQLDLLVKTKKDQLGKTDIGAALLKFQEAQEKLKELNPKLADYEAKRTKVSTAIDAAKEKYHESLQEEGKLGVAIRSSKQTIQQLRQQVEELNQSHGDNCPTCDSPVDGQYYGRVVAKIKKQVAGCEEKIATESDLLRQAEESLAKSKAATQMMRAKIEDAENKLETLQQRIQETRRQITAYSGVREPKADSAQLLLEQQISDIKQQIAAKKAELEGPSPFLAIVEAAEKDIVEGEKICADKAAQIQAEEENQPYYEYWVKAFGDNGIRKWVIDGIIPTLNSRISYWLQFLIDNKIELKFNNQLEEEIHRNPPDGSPFIYHILSNGQRRRLNLSVSQAFAYIMATTCHASPSLVFLDEVTTNIDPVGVQGIYNMICELAKEKQVFVTTHDQDLLSLLHGCDTINLVMEHGITKLKKSVDVVL